ncbi:MAG: hypothetical protein GTN53_46770, partial [Candidatus Aminicenantes bacterium]|nr:hypothetical protein [Candidatus Aminicenantes bacterium]NIQ73914.1 hypothetical protein [Candidatus Aminicenantes bacterium]NIT30015.1 hypothetical protein [Candidatus Aminicenantes bacterium]
MTDDNDVNKNTDVIRWEQISCPVCNNENFIPLFKKNNEPFVKCMECGLVLINPRPVYDQIADTYDDHYSQVYANKAEKKLRRTRRWVKRIIKKYKTGGRWLDIGC